MPSLANPSEERTGAESNGDGEEPAPGSERDHWRLRWYVGDLAHHTEWITDFGTVENLYEQYRRSEVHPGHDYAIERREIVCSVTEFHTKQGGERQ